MKKLGMIMLIAFFAACNNSGTIQIKQIAQQ